MRPQTPQLRAKALNNPTIDRAVRGQKRVQGKALTRGLGGEKPPTSLYTSYASSITAAAARSAGTTMVTARPVWRLRMVTA